MSLAAILVALPLALALVTYVLPEGRRVAAILGTASLVAAAALLAARVLAEGPVRFGLGGWSAPPGIAWSVDALGILFLGVTAGVFALVSLYALAFWQTATGREDAERAFWPLWWLLWAGMNALFLTGDAFNAYVALELIGLAAVALVAAVDELPALRAALRYLLVSLAGSLAYLAGVALLYGDYGVLDLGVLAGAITDGASAHAALSLITSGLLLKLALFPLHFWLPPAHSQAPAPVSAVLSALVIKAALFLLLRFWLEVFAGLSLGWAAGLVGLLGAAAVIWGSFQALAAPRLKLLMAYSRVAQVGYLCLCFPLLVAGTGADLGRAALLTLVVAHALSKSAAFLAAGTYLRAGGTDRVAELGPALRGLPITTAALALAGISLIGLPPTGGFVGKWLLLRGVFEAGHWPLGVVVLAGSVLTLAYIFRVLVQAFSEDPQPVSGESHGPVGDPGWGMQAPALLLALGALGLGFLAPYLAPLASAGLGGSP